MNSMISAMKPQSLFIFFGFIFLTNVACAQLDSAAIDSVYFTQEIVMDSTGTSDTLDVMNIQISVNDIDFMGEVLVTVYEQSSGFPMQMVKRTKAELESNGLVVGDSFQIELVEIPQISGSYSIETQVRNFQGGNLPLITSTY